MATTSSAFSIRVVARLLLLAGFLIPAVRVGAATTTLRGTITDASNNAPCPGVFVMAIPNSYLPYATYTDASGLYNLSLPVVDPSVTHYLVITKTGYASFTETNPEIIAGQDNIHNADLFVGSLISGHVRTAVGGLPVQGTTITAASNDLGNAFGAKAFSRADGYYEVRQPPGVSRLSVLASGHASLPTVKKTLADQVDCPGLDFELYAGGSITGQVTYGGTTAAAGGVCVLALWAGATDYMPQSVTYTAADGNYTLSHVYPAETHVIAFGPAGWGNAIRHSIAVPDQFPPVAGIDLALPAGGRLSGFVCDYMNQPIAGAEVTVFPANGNSSYQQKATTNAAGTYEFPGLVVGDYSLQVKPPQGLNLQTGEFSGIQIAGGSLLTRNFILQPGGKIQGIVRGYDGLPVAEAEIVLSLDMKFPFEKLGNIKTNASGAYVIDGLSPFQNYTVSVTPPDSETRMNSVAVAKGLSVSENTVRQQDFTLVFSGGCKGRITAAQGGSMTGGSFIALNAAAAVSAELESDGQYLLSDAPEGDYLCIIQHTQAGVQTVTDYIHVTPGVLAAYDKLLPAGGVIEGYVYDAAGNSLSGVKVTAKNKFDILASMSFFDKTGFTDGTGYYRIEGVAAGTYTLQALPPSQETGGMACRQVRNLVVGEGAHLNQDFHLPQGTKVYGLLRDTYGNRLFTGMVTFWSDSHPERGGSAMADQWGNYALMLSPGTYQAQAGFTSVLGVNLAVEPLATITVPDSPQTLQHEFVMQKAGGLSGTVTDSLGRPLTLALVEAYQDHNPLPVRIGLTDGQGGFTIWGLHTGDFVVRAAKAGYSPSMTAAAVRMGEQTSDVRLALIPQTSIGGTVLDRNRRPLRDAVLQAVDSGNALVSQTTSDAGGNYALAPLAGGPYQVKATATGMKSQTLSGLVPGDRADFQLEPLIDHDQAISYPNPCRGNQITFLYWLEDDATVLVRVYNQAGALVWDWEGPGLGGRFNKQTWQVSGVAPGVYVFKITARDSNQHVRHFPAGKLTVIK